MKLLNFFRERKNFDQSQVTFIHQVNKFFLFFLKYNNNKTTKLSKTSQFLIKMGKLFYLAKMKLKKILLELGVYTFI